ncbi:MAG: dihydropteroate synthase-like protein, partial [Archaeoglobaceae archaeon]|nr:dihydropteroate synthase-like protein [Archaeoglobaceae archaeon]MDW8128863.1 dihydropteroate synthase-like protein [Archaeoglobaceae archaeon]
MKILVITGKLAEELVRSSSPTADVYVCDIDIAAFITPELLKDVALENYDLVLVPGLTAECNWEEFELEKGVKVRLGPLHAYDLREILKYIDKIELSHKIPACRLIESKRAEEVIKTVDELEKDYAFKIREVKIGGNSRMKVVAEIHKPNLEDLRERIDYYTESGADIIDLGIPLEFESELISKAIKLALDHSKLPVSVDTFNPKAIEIAVKHGVDMIMSLSSSNVEILDLIEDQAIVIAEKDLKKLFKLIEVAKRKTEKIIADPILDPPLKVAESIERYLEFRKVDKLTPMLFGVGNVTELSDADSVGINALLAFIAEEIGCNLLFTTEASPKTRGSVKELKLATYLAKIAKIRSAPPKDAGISMLVLKEKVRYETAELPKSYITAEKTDEFIRDPHGDFIIFVSNGKIFCKHEKAVIVGKTAKEIIDTILKLGLVSRLDHAGYLGRELMKAEIAL